MTSGETYSFSGAPSVSADEYYGRDTSGGGSGWLGSVLAALPATLGGVAGVIGSVKGTGVPDTVVYQQTPMQPRNNSSILLIGGAVLLVVIVLMMKK